MKMMKYIHLWSGDTCFSFLCVLHHQQRSRVVMLDRSEEWQVNDHQTQEGDVDEGTAATYHVSNNTKGDESSQGTGHQERAAHREEATRSNTTTPSTFRAVKRDNGGFSVHRVSMEDACCGPNVPMKSDAEFMYELFFRNAEVSASLPAALTLFPPRQVSNRSISRIGGTTSQMQGLPQLQLTTSSWSSCVFPNTSVVSRSGKVSSTPGTGTSVNGCRSPSRVVGAGHAHPTLDSTVGAQLSTIATSEYLERMEYARVIEALAQDAINARETLELEHRRALRDQQEAWIRHVSGLEQEIQRLQNMVRRECTTLRPALVKAGGGSGAMEQLLPAAPPDSGRSCGGAMSSIAPWRAHNHRNPPSSSTSITLQSQYEASINDGVLNPVRITEALIHLLESAPAKKKVVSPRAALGSRSPRQAYAHR